jgi:DNA-binding MarR family transcriptional regulator
MADLGELDRGKAEGRFAYEGLDRVLHEKARLSIVTSLSTRRDGLVFAELKRLCQLTDGNLSRHLDVLNKAGVIEIHKGVDPSGRARRASQRPRTVAFLTDEGRRRFRTYIEELERVLDDAKRAGAAARAAGSAATPAAVDT